MFIVFQQPYLVIQKLYHALVLVLLLLKPTQIILQSLNLDLVPMDPLLHIGQSLIEILIYPENLHQFQSSVLYFSSTAQIQDRSVFY